MTKRKSEGVEGALRRIAAQAALMIAARETAEHILEYSEKFFIGRRYEPFKSGNLAGVYQITAVEVSAYDGAVVAWGRKITARGLGNKAWDLDRIHLSRLKT